MPIPKKHLQDLYELFASIKNEKEAKLLLEDMLTPSELNSVAERWQLVQEMNKGTSHRDIAKKFGLSISKVTRGSHAMQHGNGAIALFLKRLKK